MAKNTVYNRPVSNSEGRRYAASVNEVFGLSYLLGVGVGDVLTPGYKWLVETMTEVCASSAKNDVIEDLCRFGRLLVCNLSDDRIQAIRDETDEHGWVMDTSYEPPIPQIAEVEHSIPPLSGVKTDSPMPWD
ncbi:hypothetical protein [Paratractidigestivibacter sp.]|uniref:hypothetical protein n=1 Tax=Paratractidigestivibacter sp. TaxID=2847316 RepID=UPI002ABE7724|nr:hypothetical protein [Paratractidigestivibacter sp.]